MQDEREMPDDQRIADLALKSKLLTPEELQTCKDEQKRLASNGVTSSLVLIMLTRKYITRSQLTRIEEGEEDELIDEASSSYQWPDPHELPDD